MRLNEILTSDILLEMAYTQKKAERVLASLEAPLNDQLLLLWINPASVDRHIWINNLAIWVEEIAEIVLRPSNTRPPHTFYYKFLFFEPFGGGAEIPNLLRRLRRLQRKRLVTDIDAIPDDLVKRLQAFHRDLSSRCTVKLMNENQIRAFITDH